MKRAGMGLGALQLMLALPLVASCQSTVPYSQPVAALLVTPTAQCRTQLNAAASELTGKALALAADAFTQNDSVPLATVGQSASGRMTRPSEFLRLRVGAQGCQLQLDGPAVDKRERVAALPGCNCRALPGK